MPPVSTLQDCTQLLRCLLLEVRWAFTCFCVPCKSIEQAPSRLRGKEWQGEAHDLVQPAQVMSLRNIHWQILYIGLYMLNIVQHDGLWIDMRYACFCRRTTFLHVCRNEGRWGVSQISNLKSQILQDCAYPTTIDIIECSSCSSCWSSASPWRGASQVFVQNARCIDGASDQNEEPPALWASRNNVSTNVISSANIISGTKLFSHIKGCLSLWSSSTFGH